MSLRLAFLGACPYPVPQGSQVFMRDHALAMQARGHEVCLVVYGAGIGDDDSGLDLVRGPRIPGATRTAAGPSLAKPLLDAALLRTMKHTVRSRNIDAIIAHNYEALIIALAAKVAPVVYHAHNAMADELPHYFHDANWARRLGRWLDNTFPRRADAVIAPHNRLAEYLVECGCDASRVHVIPPIADANAFTPGSVQDGLAPVLYTGNLDPYQNLDLLHEAFKQLRAQRPEARLIIATAEPNAHFPDAEIMHTSDFASLQTVLVTDAVVAVPRVSWSGYPVKLLNAMAAGKACVACESSAWPITHEYDGLIVSDNDADAFATALERLANNPNLRRTLGNNARTSIETKHNAETVSAMIEDVVDGVVRRS